MGALKLLLGKRILLRRLQPGERDTLAAWEASPELKELIGEDLLASRPWPDPNRIDLAIELLGEGLIGRVSLEHISWRARTAELKIVIGRPAFWGMGLGREAIETLTRHFLGTGKLKEIYLRVYLDNLRALRCYEKSGFSRRGLLRRQGKDFRPLVLMSLGSLASS